MCEGKILAVVRASVLSLNSLRLRVPQYPAGAS